MFWIEFLVLFLLYSFVVSAGAYYVQIFTSKENYTREELTSLAPYFSQLRHHLRKKFNPMSLIVFAITASLIGLALPFVRFHAITNSVLLFGVFSLILPIFQNHFNSSRVSVSEDITDSAAALFFRYSTVALLFFGIANAVGFTLSWTRHHQVSFLWLLVNLAIFAFLLIKIMGKLTPQRN